MNNETIQERIKYQRIWNAAKRRPQGSRCVLCGKNVTKFCNSHSIPQMILREIQDQGWVLNSRTVIGTEKQDTKDKIHNSGAFQIICNECDNNYFKKHEIKANLLKKPSDRIMAEMALKNSLLQLYFSRTEKEFNNIMKQKEPDDPFIKARLRVIELDLATFRENVSFYKGLIESNDIGGFQILYWKLLPYQIPIAAQTHIPLGYDIDGLLVNDNYDYSGRLTQSMHIAFFTLGGQSLVLAFYHRRDQAYRRLRHQFNSTSEEKRLQYLNFYLFQYASNYFFSKKLESIIDSNTELQRLAREDNGTPNLGAGIRTWDDLRIAQSLYRRPDIDSIPNFLSSDYAV